MSNGVVKHARVRLLAGASLLAVVWAMPAAADITTSGDVSPLPLGPGNTNITGQSISVGGANPGALTVNNGASLTADQLTLSPGAGTNGPTALGQVVVDGSGTTVNLVSNFVPLNIGGWGTGIMSVTGGALVSAGAGGCTPGNCQSFIGGASGATGSLMISGAGSRVDANGSLFAGFANAFGPAQGFTLGTPGGHTTATLAINSGGVLNVSGSLDLANTFGRTMNAGLGTETVNTTATVDGAGSQINVTGSGFTSLSVGSGGGATGSLTISNGADVAITSTGSNAALNVGINGTTPGGQGTVSVTGSGSSLSVSGATGTNTNVGQSTGANGSLTISNGATATLGVVSLGTDQGTGTLNVQGGAVVGVTGLFGGGGTLGGGSGTALVDGVGSALNFSGGAANVALGNNGGSGQLTVSNGATVGGVFSTSLGNFTGSTGTLTINSGGTFGTNGASIGQADGSTGTLSVSGAGSQFNATGFVGAGGNGTLNQGTGSISVLGGAAMSAGNGLSIGNGTLTVAGSGDLTVNGGGMNVGTNFGGPTAASIAGAAAVDGSGSQLLVSGANAFVGINIGGGTGGNGTLNVTNGGALSVNATSGFGFFNIAAGTPSNGGQGAVTVDGAGSSISVVGTTGSGFSIGQNVGSIGSLTIQNGGSVSSNGGAGLGSSGGNGSILVQSGGTLSLGANGANIGGSAGGSSSITVDGAGSQVSMTGGTTVGNNGTGTLTLSNNGSYSSAGGMTIGNNNGSNGTLLVQSGADLTFTGMTSGAAIGQNAGSTGTATVSGTGSTWTIGNGLNVGNNGTGTLNVLAGGSVVQQGQNGGTTIVGLGATGQGTLNINGGTMTLLNAELGPPGERHAFLGVGRDGTGTVNVSNGGQMTIGTAASGTQSGSTFGAGMNIGGNQAGNSGTTPPFIGAVQGIGTVNVDGANSRIDLLGAGAFIGVGRFGTASQGTLQITNGGQIAGAHSVTVGRGAADATGAAVAGFGATGTLLVSGANSQLTINGIGTSGAATPFTGANLNLGSHDGTGTATISNGAMLNVGAPTAAATGGGIFVGNGIAGSNGTLNIQSGAVVNVASTVTGDTSGPVVSIGQSSNGLLSINGGTLNVTGTDAALLVGRNAGSTGTATIVGGSTVNADVLVVGSNTGSTGTLTIGGAGTVVNLTGDATGVPTTGGGLAIGRQGTGSATISGGATVNIDATSGGGGVRVGGSDTAGGGTGSLIVTGAGTAVSGSGGASLHLGRNAGSTGTMTISDGATVTFDPSGSAVIGHTAGSSGILTVTGTGSVLNAGGFLGIGQQSALIGGGTGVLNVTNGGEVVATTVHNGATGTITGSGTITATTFINDGVINPGNSPGTLRIHAADFENNGTIVLEIQENPDGTYSLDTLIFDDGFVPDLNNVEFVFLGDTNAAAAAAAGQLDIDNFLKAEDTVLGIVSLTTALGNEAPPPSGPSLLSLLQSELDTTTFAASSENGTQTIDLTNYNPTTGGGAAVTDVPEPESLALLAPGLLGLYWLRRRRAA